MNEISNFCNGACSTDSHSTEWVKYKHRHSGPRVKPLESDSTTRLRRSGTETSKSAVDFSPTNPPYAINNFDNKAPLNTKTLDMDATHMNGAVLEYNAHNLYGISEAIATNKALEGLTKKRSFVLSRSTFPGSGAHTGHWTGMEVSVFRSVFISFSYFCR